MSSPALNSSVVSINTSPFLEAVLRPEEAVELLYDKATPGSLCRSVLEMLWDHAIQKNFKPGEEHAALAGALSRPYALTVAMGRTLAPGILNYICKRLGDEEEETGTQWSGPAGRFYNLNGAFRDYFSRAPIPEELIAELVAKYKRAWSVDEVSNLARALALRAARLVSLKSTKARTASRNALTHLEGLYADKRSEVKASAPGRTRIGDELTFSLRSRLPLILSCLYPATSTTLLDMAINDAGTSGWYLTVDVGDWPIDPAVAVAKHMALPALYSAERIERLMAVSVSGERVSELDSGLAKNPNLSPDHAETLYSYYSKSNSPYLAGEMLAHREDIRSQIIKRKSKGGAMGLAIAAEQCRRTGRSDDLTESDRNAIAELALEGLRQCVRLRHGENNAEWPRRRCEWCGNWTAVISFVYRNLAESQLRAVIVKGDEEWAHHFAHLWKMAPADGPVLEALLDSANEDVRRQLLGVRSGKKRWQPYVVRELWQPFGGGRSDPGRKKRGELYRAKILPTLARDSSAHLGGIAKNLLSQLAASGR